MDQHGFVSWTRWVDAMAAWTFDLAAVLQRGLPAWQPDAPAYGWMALTRWWSGAVLAWPFDMARVQHAASVRAGLAERSLLASAEFEQGLGLAERLTLGPWARRV